MPLKRSTPSSNPQTASKQPTTPVPALSEERYDLAKLPSYKTPWGKQANTWQYSADLGATSSDSGSDCVDGRPIGLYLEISPARKWDGTDYRLRLPLITDQGPAELNLNAINTKDGMEYVTSPVKSLIAGLESLSESEEDIACFCEQARFQLVRGTRSIFIELSARIGERWCTPFTDARTTNLYGPKTPAELIAKIALIHRRIRGFGYFEATPKACFCAQELMNQIMGGNTHGLALPQADD